MHQSDLASEKHTPVAPVAISSQTNAELWKDAEGRLRWQHLIGLFGWPTILIVLGFGRKLSEGGLSGMFQDPSGVWFVALGLLVLGVTVWWHMHERIKATLEIMRRLDPSRS